MKKLLISIPMALCWLYFMSGVVILFAIVLAIYLSVLLSNMPLLTNVLPNLLGLINTLGDNGFVGLITLGILIGQYFLAFNLFNYFKKHYDE